MPEGPECASTAQSINRFMSNKILTNVSEASNSILAQVLGFITLIVSATTVFVSLQDGINQVWGLQSKTDKSFYSDS
mgnify:CR=1 FL=1